MKKALFTMLFSLGMVFSYAQTENPGIINLTDDNNWQLYQETDLLQIYSKMIRCDLPDEGIRREMVILKFVNRTNQTVNLEWDMQLFYNGNCRTCNIEGDAYHYKLSLNPNAILEGDCSSEKELLLFSKFVLDKEMKGLTNFELANLKIE
ncbi:hypothetical protein ACFL6I_27475 [candidate division KSB1 bacterium]